MSRRAPWFVWLLLSTVACLVVSSVSLSIGWREGYDKGLEGRAPVYESVAPTGITALCSDDNKHWWPARKDGQCYLMDHP